MGEERNGEQEEEQKDRRKEKKAKKSKKKNKKKDKETESEDDDKENKKKKKKSKKRKEKESEEEGEREGEQKEETTEHKPLVPYDEGEEPRTNEESVDEDAPEKAEDKPSIDPTKFFNSFSETVVEEVKPKLKLPTLIFNEKTVELAPREEVKPETKVSEAKIDVHKENTPEPIVNSSRAQNLETDSKKQQDKPTERPSRHEEAKEEGSRHEETKKEVEAAAPSKWDLEESFTGEEFALQLNVSKDEFNGMEMESPQKDLKEEPTTALKKALENIKEKEKGGVVRKKRRSTKSGS